MKAIAIAVLLALGAAQDFAQAAADDPVAAKREALMAQAEAIRTNEAGLSEPARLQEFIDLYFEYTMNEFPTFATFIGYAEGDHDRMPDQSFAAVERRNADARTALEVLESINRFALEGDNRLNYDLMHQNLVDAVRGQEFRGEYMPVNQLGGVHSNVAQLMSAMPARSVSDYENMLGRLRAVGTMVDDAMDLMERGLESGITPPRITLRDVAQQIENQMPEDPAQAPLIRPFDQMPESIPAEKRERLQAEAVTVMREVVYPAYGRLLDYWNDTYLEQTRESIGMSALPNGKAWYAYNVQQMTTTELTPEEIHQIGLDEVKRIRAEMERIIEDTGFEGSFAEFTEFLRTDERFYFESAEELLAEYRNISKKADPELVKLFGTLPRTPYGVVPVPEYNAKSSPTAYYLPGSLEAGRPGNFYANTYDLAARPRWEMEALTLHEAVPGHHFQISLQQEAGDLPWFRRFGGYTAYIEGWGLYAESLGEEMGFYKDPYSKFGQLTYEMWRAIRLVVDTGMHHMGWSRERAIDFFKENTSKTEHDIVVEVDRYLVMPGQALAYKIGELKLKELRAYAEKELGAGFDIRAFHDRILANGALPLTVLETHIREWVAEQKLG